MRAGTYVGHRGSRAFQLPLSGSKPRLPLPKQAPSCPQQPIPHSPLCWPLSPPLAWFLEGLPTSHSFSPSTPHHTQRNHRKLWSHPKGPFGVCVYPTPWNAPHGELTSPSLRKPSCPSHLCQLWVLPGLSSPLPSALTSTWPRTPPPPITRAAPVPWPPVPGPPQPLGPATPSPVTPGRPLKRAPPPALPSQ